MNTTIKTIATLAFWLAALLAPAHAQSLQDEWWTPGFSARVKLAPCVDKNADKNADKSGDKADDKLCGNIVWAWDDQPIGAADKRPLVGQRIIIGMKADKPNADKAPAEKNKSYSGDIYNPQDGHTYKATMRLKSANTLVVAGCVLFICREQIWRRHDSLKSPPVSVGP